MVQALITRSKSQSHSSLAALNRTQPHRTHPPRLFGLGLLFGLVLRPVALALVSAILGGALSAVAALAHAVVAALFGALHPLWTIPSAFLFGSLLTGANNLQRVLQIPSPLAVALNGIVVVFVVSFSSNSVMTDEASLKDPSGESVIPSSISWRSWPTRSASSR